MMSMVKIYIFVKFYLNTKMSQSFFKSLHPNFMITVNY